MQLKQFIVPVGDNGKAMQELNAFLRGNKVLEVDKYFHSTERGAYWSFCVSYIERAYDKQEGANKIDYRETLDEATFKKFSELRKIRKRIATEEGLSAFIIFTDAELAEMARLEEVTEKSMLKIKGVGEKKVERFAKYFIKTHTDDETSGAPD